MINVEKIRLKSYRILMALLTWKIFGNELKIYEKPKRVCNFSFQMQHDMLCKKSQKADKFRINTSYILGKKL